jgi:hypothetical protein
MYFYVLMYFQIEFLFRYFERNQLQLQILLKNLLKLSNKEFQLNPDEK